MGASGITISQKARFGVCLVKSVPSAIASAFCVAIGVEVLGRVRQEEEKTKNMVSLGLYFNALMRAACAYCMPASRTAEPLLIQYTTDPSSELDSVVSSLICSSIESLSESLSPEEKLLSSLARRGAGTSSPC